jgi:hypothetical protein
MLIFFRQHTGRATTRIAPTRRKNHHRKRPIHTKIRAKTKNFAQIEKKLADLFGF